jgi:AraC-like DNA-binding protein
MAKLEAMAFPEVRYPCSSTGSAPTRGGSLECDATPEVDLALIRAATGVSSLDQLPGQHVSRDMPSTKVNPPPPIEAAARVGNITAASPSRVRAAPLLALVLHLRAAGLDPTQAWAEAGLGADLPSDPEQRVAYREATALLGVCVRLSGRLDFGLQAGTSLGLAYFGLTGDLMRHSPTVGDALRAFVAHFRLHDEGGSVLLEQGTGIATLSYLIHEPGAQAVDQVADFSLAIAVGLMRDLCGADWRPSLVRFAHREPADTAPFRKLFGSRLEFDSAQNALVFAASWLALPLSTANPHRLHALSDQAATMQRADRASWGQRLRASIRAALAIGEYSIDQVAGVIGVHRRTLERRLRGEGATFADLLDNVRHEVAIQLLENTRLPMTEISYALGFAEPADFSRAFRRWRGVSPSTWRRQCGAARPPE